MTIKKIMRIIPGLFIIVSVMLGVTVNEWWFAFTLFVGVNLLQSGFTGFCPLESILKAMKIPEQ